MIQLMVDLETFSVGPQASITQFGVCLFNYGANPEKSSIIATLCWNVDLQSCLDAGMQVDASTIEWWLRQGKAARHSIAGIQNKKYPIRHVLDSFSTLYEQYEIELTWAHPSWFDITILCNAYWLLNRKVPWERRSIRDSKTLFDLVGYDPRNSSHKPKVKHNAGDDAEAQAKQVMEALTKFRE